jgi:hypothetical protein
MVGKDSDDYNEEFTDLDGVIIPDESGGYASYNIMYIIPINKTKTIHSPSQIGY